MGWLGKGAKTGLENEVNTLRTGLRPSFFVIGVAVAAVFSLLMFAWLSWHTYNTFGVGQQLKEEYVLSEDLRDKICNHHQRLAVASVMYVSTGNERWVRQHDELAKSLTSLLDHGGMCRIQGHNHLALDRARMAHTQLRALESSAFDAVHGGRKAEALAILGSDDYERWRETFSTEARRFVVDYRDYLNERLRHERNKEVLSLVVAFVIFFITLVVWVRLMRRLESRSKALAREIGEREKAEVALRRREALLSQAQSIARLGSWEFDLASGCGEWSPEFYHILGRAPESSGSRQDLLLDSAVPEDLPRLREAMAAAERHDGSYDAEIRIVRPDGEQRVLRVRARVEGGAEGHSLRTVGTIYDMTERKRIEAKLERSQQQLRMLAAHLQSAREQERAAIAREIHDEMGQALTALKIDLFRLKQKVPEQHKELHGLATGMVVSVDSTIASVQRIMSELRPPVLDDLGLFPAVDWQTGQFQERTGIRCFFESNDAEVELSPDVSLALFRILQESLTNVARHSRASNVWVHLSTESNGMVLEVSDDGCGISPSDIESDQSFGLMGMQERARVLGGEASIEAREGGGTRVRVWVPLFPPAVGSVSPLAGGP